MSVAELAQLQPGTTDSPPALPPGLTPEPEVLPEAAPEPDRRRGARNEPAVDVDEPGVVRIGTGERSATTKRGFKVTPGVSVGYDVTDNIDRVPDAQRNNGSIFSISPFIGVEWHRPGSDLSLSAALRAQSFQDSRFVDQQVDGDVSGSGDIALIGDGLRLRGDGRVFRLSEDSLAVGGSRLQTGGRSENTMIFRNLTLSPYYIGETVGGTEYEVGYEYQLIDQSLRNDTNRLYADAESGAIRDSDYGLTGRLDWRAVEYENGFDYQNVSGLLGVNRSFGGRLKLGLGLYYSSIDELRNRAGDDSGIGPAIYWDWRPTERSVFQGQYADAYYGDSVAMRFRQLYSRWLFSSSWRKDIEDSNRASTFLFRPLKTVSRERRRSSGNERLQEFDNKLAQRDLDLDSGSELFVSSLDTALVYDNTVSVSVAGALTRSSLILSLFRSDRTAAIANFSPETSTDAFQYGAYAVYDLTINARNSVRVIGTYVVSDFPSRALEATGSGIELSWRYKLSQRAALRFSARRFAQDGMGDLFSYTENAAGVAYTYTFQ